MCGIIGIVGSHSVTDRLVDGLRRLEYRGYDSAGVAVIDADGALVTRRAPGKIAQLAAKLDDDPVDGLTGVGHTRWATHGAPNEINAHPHHVGRVGVVHNGIIENYRELRGELSNAGRTFKTDTDTETIAHAIDAGLESGLTPEQAVKATLDRLDGAYAIAVAFDGRQDLLIGARNGSPLVVGYGSGETYLGSDALTLGPLTDRITYLDDGDWVVISRAGAQIFNAAGELVERAVRRVEAGAALAEKGNYRHFMEKEIHEQPEAVARTLTAYVDPVTESVTCPDGLDFSTLDRLTIVACGTAYYAAMVAKYWFEGLAELPVDVDIASEFRYRRPAISGAGLAIAVSQSGETLDTKAALELCKRKGMKTAAVVNVAESAIARLADVVVATHAGPEIGVASTKAFTCQLSVLAALAVLAGRQRGHIDAVQEKRMARTLMETPRRLAEALETEGAIRELAHDLAKARDVLYLGRSSFYPLALEAALKLKEISYIHAEGYAAGELKHGPIALIDEVTPVVFVAPTDALFEKTASSIQEVAARGGQVILITDEAGARAARDMAAPAIVGPSVPALIAPIVYAAPIQMLAYHTAVQKGTDVDQPRNLAKSVTVE